MFTKNDYIEYFQSIKKIENKMIKQSNILLHNIHDKNAQKLLEHYHREEQEHQHIVEEIIRIIS